MAPARDLDEVADPAVVAVGQASAAEWDVVLNSNDFSWSTKTPGQPGLADVEAISAHEWGHAVGCDRIPLRDATMYFATERGAISYRTLSEDDRALVNLLVEQIEFADVVILNKIADAGPERTDAARKIIRSLNADARIIETNHSDVAADAINDVLATFKVSARRNPTIKDHDHANRSTIYL